MGVGTVGSESIQQAKKVRFYNILQVLLSFQQSGSTEVDF